MLKLYACLAIGDESDQKSKKTEGISSIVTKKGE
jgi:hypothetical protein